ncbi:MAG: LPP20 family lipoprotein [Elusimicrobiota bacterium]|jgi:hypothetical protein|nr:LPP20 family lipoprotein [Elusimicrobiota bacterium]
MKKLEKLALSVILSIIFCADIYSQERPKWIDNPDTIALNNIAAVGTGKTQNEANANARAEILKYFEVNVSQKFEGSLSGKDDISTKLSKEEVAETASAIIKGISISKTYKDAEGFYALAILDKRKAINELSYEIDALDSKMKILLDDGDSAYSAQLKKMYLKREELNKKHIFLADKPIGAKVKYEDIFKSGKNREPLNFYLAFKDASFAGITPLKNKLSSLIINSGFTTSSDIERANRVMTVFITYLQEYMNVAGFEKWKFTFRIECKDGSKAVGIVTEEYVETGREIMQAYGKALNKFSAYLDANYEKLLQ